MRHRLRVLLPLTQVAIATILKATGLLRRDTGATPQFLEPGPQACDAINAPVALIQQLLIGSTNRWLIRLDPSLSLVIEDGVYLLLVWLVWYSVTIEMEGNGLSTLAPMTGSRTVADAVAIMFAFALGAFGFLACVQLREKPVYAFMVGIPYFLWFVIGTVFYARDLVTSRRLQ